MGPRLGPVGWLRWGWRQLTSMRTALALLFLLAVAAIPGSVLPQRATDPIAVTNWLAANQGIGPVLDTLGLFDVFAAPWFTAVYVLLFISLIGCVLPRVAAHARAMRQPTPPAPRRLDRLTGATNWNTDATDTMDRAAEALRAQRWRVTRDATTGPVGSLAAERGLARETGNLLFHVALVLILVGVALGSLLGWKGNVIVREGSGFSNTLTQYDEFSPGRLAAPTNLPPFSFTLKDFEVTFEREGSQRGAPRSFSAQLDYTSAPGEPMQSRTVSVNSPLRVDGAKVYLVGHGYAPHLRLTDSKGRVVFDDAVVFLPQDGNFSSVGIVKSPDADPPLAIDAIFAPSATISEETGPISTFPAPDNPGLFASAWTGDLGLDSGQPQNVFRLDTQNLTRLGIEALTPGQAWTLPDGQGTLEFVDLQRWASFRIAYDPGRWLALLGAVLALAGLSLSLFVKRRRIWVRVGEDEAGSESAEGSGSGTVYRVQVAGLSRTDSADVIGEVQQLVARLGGPARKESS
jgi:cytochrome c biogenesis protein